MTPESTVDIFRHAIYLTVIMISLIVIPGLIVGLLVAMFQAATQINEMSMSFVPKLLITFLVLLMAGPWLLNLVIDYFQQLVLSIPSLIG